MRAPTPVSRRRTATRTVASLWLLLYALIAAVLPLADARAEHGASVVVHVEDGTGSDCPASHDASVCHTCQVLTASVRPTVAGTGWPAAVQCRESPSAALDLAAGRPGLRGEPASRAPPRA